MSQDYINGAEYAHIVIRESGPIIAVHLAKYKGHLDNTQKIDFVAGYCDALMKYRSVTG